MGDEFVKKRYARSDLIEKTISSLESEHFFDSLPVEFTPYYHEIVKQSICSFLCVSNELLGSGSSICFGPVSIGTLEVFEGSKRKGRHIQENKIVEIPERYRIRVKPSRDLKKRLIENGRR